MKTLETHRKSILSMYEEYYPTELSRQRLRDAFESWYEGEMLRLGEGVRPIMGGATPLTSLRVRHRRLSSLVTTVGQSQEVDFNIAFGQAIEISAIHVNMFIAAVSATQSRLEALVDLDGPALDGNSLVSLALIEARQELESCIANFANGNDALTSGAAITDTKQQTIYTEPILTARNPGVAAIATTSSGAMLFDIHYKLLAVTRDEQLLLFALGRA